MHPTWPCILAFADWKVVDVPDGLDEVVEFVNDGSALCSVSKISHNPGLAHHHVVPRPVELGLALGCSKVLGAHDPMHPIQKLGLIRQDGVTGRRRGR